MKIFHSRRISSPSLIIFLKCVILVLFLIVLRQLTSTSRSLEEIINRINSDQVIINKLKFPRFEDDSVVIVVQVHKRVEYLRFLISSLSKAKGISATLLIFSHDFYDEEINELVQSVDFCRVMQIFLPFSIQIRPNEFPGTDPNDCERDMKKEEALVANCTNANNPDLYGHYREASFAQIKHHWWWKANSVFDQLEATRHHTGMFLFLEEDHYVTEDFLYAIKMMRDKSAEVCPSCKIFTLGNSEAILNSDTFDKLEALSFVSSKHGWGLAFDRDAWHEIKSCAADFCSYDDYNWDWTLQFILQKCLNNKLNVLVLKAPRVFHIGDCGIHFSKDDCDANESLRKVEDLLNSSSHLLHPESLKLLRKDLNIAFEPKPNGGWSDVRDISHCLQMCYN